jgi:pilus assembly protein CpaC
MMRNALRNGVALWLVVLAAAAHAAPTDGRTVHLGVGAQTVLPISGISRIAVGDPNVADVKAVGGQVLIVGVGEGRTTLIVWRSNGQRFNYLINVRKQDPNEVMGELRRLLGDIEGVSVRMVGDRVFLDGQAYTSQDADRIDQVVSLYPNVRSFVKVAPNAKKLVAQNLNAAFQKAGLKRVQVNVVNSTLFLEGSVESQADLQKAELITQAMGEKVENLLSVGVKQMILSEVQFVEIRRNGRDRYGVKYPTDITGTAQAIVAATKGFAPPTDWSAGLITNFSAQADLSFGFQANDGYGRLLAQPRLVCASGDKAEFLAGGEVPIPLITDNQLAVEFKKYGIILNIKPTADRNGNIQTELEAEVSEVDTSVSVSSGGGVGIPGFRTRRVKTSVTVRHGETIVLSGVFSHDEQKAVSKIPGVGNLPIVGELFKNRAFDSTKRELVIFVTPRIVTPESDRVRSLIDDVKNRYKAARSEVGFNIFD